MLSFSLLVLGPRALPLASPFGTSSQVVEQALGTGREFGARKFFDRRTRECVYLGEGSEGDVVVSYVSGRVVRIRRSFGFYGSPDWQKAMDLCGYPTQGLRASPTPPSGDEKVWRITGSALPQGYEAFYRVQSTQTKPVGPSLTITGPRSLAR